MEKSKLPNEISMEEAGGKVEKDTIVIKPHKGGKKRTEEYENGGG